MTDERLDSEVRHLADLVSHQEGSIVSRALLTKGNGSVTLFAFDSGESLSEHTTPHDALVIVLEGTLTITLAGTAHRVSEGEVLLMPAGIAHALEAEAPSKMLLTMVHE